MGQPSETYALIEALTGSKPLQVFQSLLPAVQGMLLVIKILQHVRIGQIVAGVLQNMLRLQVGIVAHTEPERKDGRKRIVNLIAKADIK